ncbi:Type I restriction enzyme EcoKI R protein [Folsomia candida]|uniref:Type I restriction enzyme EcoKI R protein n=1 Tax=Folsomia candida TaxID=158441 RepID=A0A226DUC4_FOLCA|nr:Type I restriction enzyme EcoKI R protein [Folsomia candida]
MKELKSYTPFKHPEFFQDLRKDIDEALLRHVGQERRLVGEHAPQAMILVTTKREAEDTAEALGEDATFIVSTKEGDANLKLFHSNQKKIAVVFGMLREGYDNACVTLVVFLRNVKSRVLFEQFCGRCIRMNRKLQISLRSVIGADQATGTVLTYNCYPHLKELWNEREKPVADDDPIDEVENNHDK